jgi:hypothetical protein
MNKSSKRIAAGVALALIYAIAFYYGRKYEADVLTDHFQTTVTPADLRGPTPVVFDQKAQ